MKAIYLLFLSLLFLSTFARSQTATLSGVIKDAFSNELLPFTNVVIFNTNRGTATDIEGRFFFEGLEPGFVRLQVSTLGYEPLISEEILISAVRYNYIEIALRPTVTAIEEVRVVASPFARRAESPVSLQRIGVDFIERSAGTGRDFGRVLQSFPGVASTTTFRNDLIVRGGGPSENRFFLDGIEIPVLNHFSTQGASGGPVSILNVDFIREVDFYSGAFPASRGNALSSVFEFRQIDPNPERANFKATVGASELSLSANTPLTGRTSAIFSARRSYLQFLFDQLGLPFLPTFNDFQLVSRTRFDRTGELTILGVGAIGQFRLNPTPEPTIENRYILSYVPINEQWNYTIGASYRHFMDNSFYVVSLSRSHLNNTIYKYRDNDESSIENLISDYISDEIGNKARFEVFANPGGWTLSTGFNLEHSGYFNRTLANLFRDGNRVLVSYSSRLDFLQYGMFGSVSRSLLNERLTLSGGVRFDGNSYSDFMSNPLRQFSPRFSASYMLVPSFFLNASTGRYYQLPPYTSLGFRDNSGNLVNRANNIQYISANHIVGGVEWRINNYTRATLEGFDKQYANYPVSVADGISLASKGADFGVLGDEEVVPLGEGRSYGLEFMVQQRSPRGLSFIFAYTWVKSEFSTLDGNFIPSSWDSGHLVTFTLNKTLPRDWNVGVRWRYTGAFPFTPVDRDLSEQVSAWDLRGREYLDFSRFNQGRLDPFHQLDLRVGKTYNFNRFSFGFYFDVQNVYNYQITNAPRLVQALDANGQPILQGTTPERYVLDELLTTSGTFLPTIGLIMEF